MTQVEKPYFGAINTLGQWWDGKNWKSLEKDRTGSSAFSVDDCFTTAEILRSHAEAGAHVDGVFKCPRCRKMHFLIDTFDYLCDGCIAVLLEHTATSKVIRDGIANWRDRSKDPNDSLILARRAERDQLANSPADAT